MDVKQIKIEDNTDYKHLPRTSRQVAIEKEGSPVRYSIGTDDYRDIRVAYLCYDVTVSAKEPMVTKEACKAIHSKVQRKINEFILSDKGIVKHIFDDEFSNETVKAGTRLKYQGAVYFAFPKAPVKKIHELKDRLTPIMNSIDETIIPELEKNFNIKQRTPKANDTECEKGDNASS